MTFYKEIVYQFDIEQGCSLVNFKKASINKDEVKYAMGRRSGGGGGGGTTQVIEQKNEPWSEVRRPLKRTYQRAEELAQQPRQFFPNQTFVNFDPATQQALNMIEQKAQAGIPGVEEAQQQLAATLGGDFLHGGPEFNAAVQAAQNQVLPQVRSQYARGGRYGSGLARTAEVQALGDIFAKQYAQERQNQMRGLMMAPQIQNLAYGDAARLAAVGGTREEQAQKGLDEQIARHSFAQEEPKMRNIELAQLLAGSPGGSMSGSGYQQANPFTAGRGAQILGGALGGAGLAGMIGGMGAGGAGGAGAGAAAGMGPWGLGLGALAGGLLGGFF